jgi:hypothetical protein
MNPSKRRFLMASAAVSLGCLMGGNVLPGQKSRSGSVKDPIVPEDMTGNTANNPSTAKALLEQHQKEIKKDVEKLFDLATELKAEVEKTDSTAVLSLAMLKKAEEVERLAREIRDRAKG